MSPGFLKSVAAAHLCSAGLELVKLWQLKGALANGHPFRADQDLNHGIFEAMWAAVFGQRLGVIDAQVKLLSSIDALALSDDQNEPAKMPQAHGSEVHGALETLVDTAAVLTQSLFPRPHHFYSDNFQSTARPEP